MGDMQTMPDPQRDPILLLTRPEAAARRFVAQLGLGVEVLIAPLLRIDQLDVDPAVAGLAGIILTSENGAVAAGRLPGLPQRAWCVGDRTAEAAGEAGFDPISARGDADALVALILSGGETGPLLHIRGEHARGDVAGRLNAAGVMTRDVVAYRQTSQPLSPGALAVLAGNRPVILPLFSPRTVTILAEHGRFTAPVYLVAISQAVADVAARLHPRSLLQADGPDATAMAGAVRACWTALTTG